MHIRTDGPPDLALATQRLEDARARLAERMKTTRDHYGWTQAIAAGRAGLAQSEWSRIESEGTDPRLSSLLRIQYALGLASLEEFFGDSPTQRILQDQ